MTAELYGASVFINCAFDDGFKPLFRAIVFTVIYCGYRPRSALESSDGGEPRIRKIEHLIEECRLGIHDISRAQPDKATGLPRFNMPFELGLFLGARRFGAGRQKQKVCLILDEEAYRYQKFLSDISGQDIHSHGNKTGLIIERVRDWLSADNGRQVSPLPGSETISARFEDYEKSLPDLARRLESRPQKLTYSDEVFLMSEWRKSLP